MTTETKNAIIDAAQIWCTNKNATMNDLAKLAKINISYLSNMMRKIYAAEVNGKEMMISDKWFYLLSETIGYAVSKQYWSTVQTKEMEHIIHHLTVAKKHPMQTTIITETGLGKTYSIDKFCAVHPLYTYKITVNSMFKVRNIIAALAEKVGVPVRNYYVDSLWDIAKRLKEFKMQGHQPVIIIDEAENMKLPVIQALKGLYDYIIGYCSIVLIGTSQLTDSLHRMNRSNKNGAPQFYRRIKAGIKTVPVYNDFTPFYNKYGIDDKAFRRLISSLCNNYGELHDYLEPVLREADTTEMPMTEAMFRTYHNLPNL